MSLLLLRRALVGLPFLVAACGGNVVAEQTGGSGTGASGTGTTGAGAGTTTSNASTGTASTGTSSSGSPCPAGPGPGQSCAGVPDGFQCTYGSTPRPDCRESMICQSGVWESPGTACAQQACPMSQPASGATCTSMGAECAYNDTLCYCGCPGGLACAGPVTWQCAPPPTSPGCPALVPNDGAPCSSPGAQCNYGTACSPTQAVVNCTNGLWIWDTMIACGG